MESGPVNRTRIYTGVMVIALAFSAGCMGFFGTSGISAGDMKITNDDSGRHTVVVHDVGNESVSRTVEADSSQTVTLYDSPGRYAVNATIDGQTPVNYSVEYYLAGEDGDELGGPGLLLTIDADADAQISGSVE